MAAAVYVRHASGPILPPPLAQRGAIGWMRANLFSSWSSTAVTLLLAAFCLWTLPDLIAWATTRAVWRAPANGGGSTSSKASARR